MTTNSRPKVKASLSLARDMVQTIYDSGMKPGDRYLSEAEGLRRHKVGRGTYREALRFLELQGVIVMRAGPTGGAEIGQPDWHNLASTVALLMQFADAPLGAILEARLAIEPGMAELAALHATDDEIDDMATKLVAVEVEVGRFPKWSEAYNAYWRTLAQSSHNTLLASLSPALRAIVNSGGFVPNEPYRIEVLGRLRTVHAAITAHDPAAARQAMLDLLVEFQRRLSEGYPRQLEQVVCWPEVVAQIEHTEGDEP